MTLSEIFSKFEKSAKRLELLQEYHIEGDEWDTFQDYINGKPTSVFAELVEWNEQLKMWSNEGKIIERIRVIDSPLSLYLKYQIDLGYLPSALSGQVVNFVLREKFNLINKFNIKNDIWIFDDKFAFEMIYDSRGAFIESREIDSTVPIKLYNELKKSSRTLDYIVKQIRDKEVNVTFYD